MGTLLKAGKRWLDVAELAYQPEQDWQRWGAELVEAIGSRMTMGAAALNLVHVNDEGRIDEQPFAAAVGPLGVLADIGPIITSMGSQSVRAFYFPDGLVPSVEECMRVAEPRVRRTFQDRFTQLMAQPGRAIVVHPSPAHAMVLFGICTDRAALNPLERGTFVRIGLHLEAAARLRLRPESLVAVVAPNGHIEYQRDHSASPRRFESQARLLHAAQRERGERGLELWKALVGGQVSVVERHIGSRRYTHFVENPPHRQPLRALSDPERDVLAMVCQGRSAKEISYALGTVPSTTSMRLESAAAKVGAFSRVELVRLAAMLARDPRATAEPATLSRSESDVLALLVQGLSNREIAKRRSRSLRTIANQVASLLRKTRTSNRKALVSATTCRPSDVLRGT